MPVCYEALKKSLMRGGADCDISVWAVDKARSRVLKLRYLEVALFGSREATIALSLGRKPKDSKEKGIDSREAATAACAASNCCHRFAALGFVASNSLGLRPRLRAVATTWLKTRNIKMRKPG